MYKSLLTIFSTLLLSFSASAQQLSANYFAVAYPPPGFDFIGSFASGNFAPSFGITNAVATCGVTSPQQGISTNQVQQTFQIKHRQKVQSFEAVVAGFFDTFTNIQYKFRVNIWDSLNEVYINPRLGNVLSQEFFNGSPLMSNIPWGTSAGYNLTRMFFDITDTILQKNKTYYYSVQLVVPNDFSFGYLYVVESSANVKPSYVADDFDVTTNPPTCQISNVGLNGYGVWPNFTLGYKANAVYCPTRGPC